ncbi:hypothetical protein FACS1894166_05380 [Bacilli bacterium]|nr:hypothetical protein FACS1894166_05380 [Bacilli bacterium]
MLSLRKKYVIKYNICTSLDEVAKAVNQVIIKQVQDKPNSILALGSEDVLNSIYDRFSKAQLRKVNFADVIMFGIKDYIDIDTRYLKFSKFNLLNEHFLKLTNIKIDNVN